MAPSNVFWKTLSALFPFSDFVYILQLEEYSSQRFLKWLPRFFFRRNFQVRQKVEWTARAKIICTSAIALWLAFLATSWLFSPIPLATTAFSFFLIPLFVLAANAVLAIPFALVHTYIRTKAAARLANFQKHGKVVVVAGSFGKTTTKHFLEQLTRYNYRVQMTPGNVNTPSGIAAWLSQSIKPATNLLIVEVDGYSKQEYKETGSMVHADIVVVTNVGDQHLERLGSHARLAEAMGEIVAQANTGAHIVCDHVTKNSLRESIFGNRTVHIVVPETNDVLSVSNAANLALAHKTAKILNIPEAIIADTISKLELPDRRQKPTHMYGYDAIDDSYNISWTTAQAGIAAAKVAAREAGKKLLVITAGIMELNTENADKNVRLGELLATEANHTIVLDSMFADDVTQGIGNSSKYTRVKSLAEFIEYGRGHFSTNEWFLLHQPEMHDLYY